MASADTVHVGVSFESGLWPGDVRAPLTRHWDLDYGVTEAQVTAGPAVLELPARVAHIAVDPRMEEPSDVAQPKSRRAAVSLRVIRRPSSSRAAKM